MGTVNTTLSRYPSIINQYSNHSLFFVLISFDSHGDYVRDCDRDHDIDNICFHEIFGRSYFV